MSSPPPIASNSTEHSALIKLSPFLQPWKPTLLAYTASLGSVAGGYPLDSIKSRMQTHGFKNITGAFLNTVKNEGLRGLFRGISSPIFTIAISRSLNVSVFSMVKPYTSKLSLGSGDNFNPVLRVLGNNLPSSFVSGYCAGFITSLWACPFEFVKLFSQISFLENKSKIGNLEALRQIINKNGIMGLYTGYKFQFLRDTFGAAIYFTSYESIKLILNSFLTKEQKHETNSIIDNFSNSWISIALSGGLSGALCWIAIFPFDTLKSLEQKSLISTIVNKDYKTIDTLFLRGNIYRGVSASILRSFFTSTLFFSTYEYLMKVVA
ncbi:Calcium-binding mitochondrial carrier protein [Wickerhamomyces ciferrii]|uniref:Calcium-binding mitochondrial carrier protein n=1 Tax=Wickerhamomyces ciferrii (strain ATCC 14091 / BCRC 22168 / CBS 111 / JCM 3599 / NBRC 0793 / NRRL Y-1031 F-60-10) TaxID=1206466 RepID=K0KJ02_WICCF|nr:Calcium-binding mitochondrial carrier protein [Wickerhamomyces ciferrii]CCH41434.1 Calcium-binding mitochondrial carrier protein [Wickerhamomyces ciferrii]